MKICIRVRPLNERIAMALRYYRDLVRAYGPRSERTSRARHNIYDLISRY